MNKDTILENIWSSLKDSLNLSSEKEEVKEVEDVKTELAEESKEEVKEEVKEEPVSYALKSDLDAFRTEMLSMFKTLMEENKKDLKEVPQKLSKEEEIKEETEDVQLSVEEIVHSPENEVEKKQLFLSKPLADMTAQERVQYILNGNK